MSFELTGRRVFGLFALGFGTIIAVNVTLAVNAVRTFPGLEVANSYVASQHFDADRTAQQALGWEAVAKVEDGALRVELTDAEGRPVAPAALTVTVGRPTTDRDDRVMAMAFEGVARVAPMPEGGGAWLVRIDAEAMDGTAFHARRIVAADRAG
ncbi:protein RdxH [Roseivivax marinus]|uniref:Protein RdxH n=1 Tax=Roseivivax marinus TaxID=1379903 RepID=W4HKI4_9RHOB|nr:FixH family protein [Roseivivax marinus]ETW12908.1 protein RdxH [Roseivivax marinus]